MGRVLLLCGKLKLTINAGWLFLWQGVMGEHFPLPVQWLYEEDSLLHGP